MEPFKEKNIVKIMNVIIGVLGISWILCLILIIFDDMFVLGFLLLPACIPFILLSWLFSEKNEYTRGFLKYIRDKADKADNLRDLIDVNTEFERLAINNKCYCLSFPNTLREFHYKILNQIAILEKIDERSLKLKIKNNY